MPECDGRISKFWWNWVLTKNQRYTRMDSAKWSHQKLNVRTVSFSERSSFSWYLRKINWPEFFNFLQIQCIPGISGIINNWIAFSQTQHRYYYLLFHSVFNSCTTLVLLPKNNGKNWLGNMIQIPITSFFFSWTSNLHILPTLYPVFTQKMILFSIHHFEIYHFININVVFSIAPESIETMQWLYLARK